MFYYRGHEVQEEVIRDSVAGGSRKRTRIYRANVEMQDIKATSEEGICDKIDEILSAVAGAEQPN